MNYQTNTIMNAKNYISIIKEFRALIDFINTDVVLIEKIFGILDNHFNYNVAGIFFNSPDNLATNLLNVSIKNTKVNPEYIKSTFFNEIGKHKKIIKSSINITKNNANGIENPLKNKLILPLTYDNKLLGGICLFSKDEILKEKISNFNLVITELLSIFKLKYIYSEQIFNSSIDALTGLYNRHQLELGLKQEFYRSQRYNSSFSLAMVDVDHFKNINDTYGHQYGDYVLCEISNIIQQSFRKTDIVYRYGGEEIVILMPTTEIKNAVLPLERLREKISKYNFEKDGIKTKITISIGIGTNRVGFKNEGEIIKDADTMLYSSKQNGRNKISARL